MSLTSNLNDYFINPKNKINPTLKMHPFFQRKLHPKKDKSIKNSYDKPIINIIENFNKIKNYNTLSSCSGRICIYSEEKESIIYSIHDFLNENLYSIIKNIEYKNLYFKFEPILLHVECYDLESAKYLFKKLRSNGFRNSGIVLSKRIIVELRCLLKLDVPIKTDKIIITEEYSEILKEIANKKMKKNFEMIKKLEQIVNEVKEKFN